MIRYASIALVISGLIVQPLMAVMPVAMMLDNTQSSMDYNSATLTNAHGHHVDSKQEAVDPPKAPCHEQNDRQPPGESSPGNCICCDFNCAHGFCVIGSSVAAIHKVSTDIELNADTQVNSVAGARSHGFPSRIFHPPRHA